MSLLHFLKRTIPVRLEHSARMLFDGEYRSRNREISRLQSLPRYEPSTTNLLGKSLYLIDAASFLSAYYQIFEKEIYYFGPSSETPVILDCGANIGLSTLYWKSIYPTARITAFEPDPEAFEALARNCKEWQVSNVKQINKAVWKEESQLRFLIEGGDGGHLVPESLSYTENTIAVPTVRLRDWLNTPIDLLKLDIEGAEVDVLEDCADSLHHVEYLFVEYHSFIGQEQRIDHVLYVLRSTGFRIHIQPELVSPKPFVRHINSYGMDQRLNIFAYRNFS